MLIDNRQFSGERPKKSARNLNTNEAQLALDCMIVSDELRPMRVNSFSESIPATDPMTIFLDDDDWITFDDIVYVIGDSLNSDLRRVYWTSENEPPQQATIDLLNAGISYRIGVPQPAVPPGILQPTGEAVENDPETLTSFFITTLVNAYGEEGHRSDPSPLFNYMVGQTLTITGIGEEANPGVAETYNVTAQRVYLQIEGVPRFVAEIPFNETQHQFNSDMVFGEAFNSEDYFPPPIDMQGLHLMANGVAAGFVGRTVFLSEAFLPNAWPFSFEVSDDIVGLSSYDNNLVIGTEGYPEVAAILDPSNVSSAVLADREPCVSQRGMVQGANGVIFPSPSVLYYVGAGGGRALTEDYFDDNDWADYAPETFNSVFRDGQYIAFHESDRKEGNALVFDMREVNAVATQISDWGSAVHVEAGSNNLFLAQGNDIVLWQGGEQNRTYTWRSKMHGGGSPFALTAYRLLSCDFEDGGLIMGQAFEELVEQIMSEHELSFEFWDSLSRVHGLGGAVNGFLFGGCGSFGEGDLDGRVIPEGVNATQGSVFGNGTAGSARRIPASLSELSVTIEIFKDKVKIDSITVTADDPGRINYADRGRLWEYELRGTVDLTQASLAGSIGELYNGS